MTGAPAKLGQIIAKGVWAPEKRHAQIRQNLLRDIPRLQKSEAHTRRLDICGYAPSIVDTIPEVLGDILTISGAHGLLIEAGKVPKFHLEVDPRDDKTPYITPPHKDVTYLFSATCSPVMFECVKDHHCLMWLNYNTAEDLDFISDEFPGTELVYGGSTAGLFSMVVGYLMGYRDIHIHGMDSSNKNETERHAGEHFGKPQKSMQIEVGEGGPRFWTSGQMVSQAREFFNIVDRMKDSTFTVHGTGLLQAMIPIEHTIEPRANLKLFGGLHV